MHPIAPHVNGSALLLVLAIFCLGLGIYFMLTSAPADDEDDWTF